MMNNYVKLTEIVRILHIFTLMKTLIWLCHHCSCFSHHLNYTYGYSEPLLKKTFWDKQGFEGVLYEEVISVLPSACHNGARCPCGVFNIINNVCKYSLGNIILYNEFFNEKLKKGVQLLA